MRFVLLALALCMVAGISGCILSSNPPGNWSKNIALNAKSADPRYHDDNMYSRGETSSIINTDKDKASQREADRYTEALLYWQKPQTIQRVVVKAEEGQMEFFSVEYMDEAGKWVTIREVRDNLRPVYRFTLKDPIVTTKFRLKVPRRADSRRVGGQRRTRRGDGGTPTGQEHKRIQEIELYYMLPLDPIEAGTTGL